LQIAETIKRVLVSNHRNYTIGVGLDRVRILVGNGIIVSEGDVWKRQHRLMQPMSSAFARRAVRRTDRRYQPPPGSRAGRKRPPAATC